MPLHFLKIVVEVRALGLPHILTFWLEVSRGMLPVKYFCFNKCSFCLFKLLKIIHNIKVKSGHPLLPKILPYLIQWCLSV